MTNQEMILYLETAAVFRELVLNGEVFWAPDAYASLIERETREKPGPRVVLDWLHGVLD